MQTDHKRGVSENYYRLSRNPPQTESVMQLRVPNGKLGSENKPNVVPGAYKNAHMPEAH